MTTKFLLFKSIVLIMVMTLPSFAQVVTIPDANFKYKLVNHIPPIDLDADGEIQVSEAEVFNGTMNVSYEASDPDYITDVTGLEAFINVEEFVASYQNIQSIDLSENSSLKLFNASGNEFSTLSFTNHPLLESVQTNYGQLLTLDVSGAPNLVYLNAQGNELNTIDLGGNPILEGIQLDNNPIANYDFSQNPLLRFVYCRNNTFSTLDLSFNPLLIAVDCQDNAQLTYLNLKNGNNQGLNISGSGPSCAFYDLPLLETVCLDAIDSPLANFILDHVDHSVTFQEECILGTKDKNSLITQLYPNPTDGFLFLRSETNLTHLQVYNLFGKRVLNQRLYGKEQMLDLHHLSAGLYFLRVAATHKGHRTLKFMKN